MMKPQDARWIEIQFYFILYDIWKLNNRFKDILDFCRCVKIFNSNFNESRICSLAQAALLQNGLRLNVDEYVVLSWINRVPFKSIKKYKKLHNQTLGRLIHQYMNNPDDFYFYPRNTEEDINHINDFLIAVQSLRGVGIAWKIPFTRNFGKYSNRSELKP